MANIIRVYGKAQNRMALGIIHAYMSMHPEATLDDLRQAFPNNLNPDKGVKENFIYAEEKGSGNNWDGFFKRDDELLTTGDGRKVAVVKMWTKPSFLRMVEHTQQYGIEVCPVEAVEEKVGFKLERLDCRKPAEPVAVDPADAIRDEEHLSMPDHPLLTMLKSDMESFIAEQTELLFNERDLQTTLAEKLRNSGHYDDVDLEYGVPLEELEARGLKISKDGAISKDFPWPNRLSIDIVVSKDDAFAAIELKYTTRTVNETLYRFGEELKTKTPIVRNQAASNLVMYNYWKDVRRIEALRKCYHKVCGGIALMITNNSTYWDEPQGTSAYRTYSMHEGNTVGGGFLDWAGQPAQSIIESHPPFVLDGKYHCYWHNTVMKVSPAFRYMLVVV